MTITVNNVYERPSFNEEIPQGETTLTREVAENTAAGQPVGAPVSAKDDDGDTITYSLDDQDGANFEIDSNGQIKTKSELDYETTQSYSVTVSVTDGIGDQGNAETPGSETEDDSIGVTINVTDVNEKPQFADDAPITQEVAENTPAQTNIGTAYTATDPERDTLTYTLDTGDGASFEIDSVGQIKTLAALDYESDPIKRSYSVTVSVSDNKDADGNADTVADDTHTVTITVTDVDDPGTITFSSDDPSAGTTLTAILDDDDGVKADVAVTWVWESSTDQSNWTPITDADTDSITLGTDDVGNYYRVTATYDDDLDSGNTAQGETTNAVVTAPITNQQPTFADPTATRTVAENTPAGRSIGDPVAVDEPDDNVGTLVYSLDAIGAETFDIDGTSGQLKTKTALDYENGPTSYTVTVSVTDGLDDHSLSDGVVDGTITVTVNVTDVNEPPQFADDAAATLEVSEATSTGTDIGNAYTATDPENDTLTYSLTGTDASLFTVGTDGQLQVADTLDFESKPSLSVTINVTDSMDAAGNAEAIDDTHEVTITVTNVFEDPRFGDEDGTGSTTRSVPENTPADQPIGAPVSADDDEESTLTYELTGTDSDSFSFDSASGQIKTKDPLDHEAKDSYSVTVSVSDGKDAADGTTADTRIDTTITVTIEVEDVNEKPAFADGAVTDLSIAENTAADQDIGAAFTATDPDEDPADTLTYGLEGTDAASFDIDMATGQIKTKGDLDHEGKETYSVTVTVRDSRDINGDADTATDATIAVTITVTDVDDPGEIRLSPSQPNAGSEVTATLEDDDGVKTTPTVTWKWESSSDKSTWSVIEGATTNTYIPQQSDINNYLRVTATYADELGTDKTAQRVSDSVVLEKEATNQQPSFDEATATRSILENTAADQTIGDPIAATPNDAVGTLTYSLDTTGATTFDIDSATGQLKTKVDLDFETTPSYTVTVSVSDGMDYYSNADTRIDDSIEVTINITDIQVPDVPAAPTVNPTSGAAASLTGTWTAVAATETRPLDGYEVQYRVKDTQTTQPWLTTNITINGTKATITGLAYSTTYEVQVRSKNAEGESGWSPTGEGTIPSRLNVAFSPASQSVDEGSSASYTVTVSPAADRDLSIRVSISAGTAESDDYSPTSTDCQLRVGQHVKVVLDIHDQRLRPG